RMEEAYVGLEPRGRWRPSHPVRLGSPSVPNVPRVRAHASALGPLVPSQTIRRYQPEDARRGAQAATVRGVGGSGGHTPLARTAPLSIEGGSRGRGRWRLQRVSAGTATNAVPPTQASTASRQAGRLPESPSATRDVQGRRPSLRRARTLSAAHWGLGGKAASSGILPLCRRSASAARHHGGGRQSRLSTSAAPCREAEAAPPPRAPAPPPPPPPRRAAPPPPPPPLFANPRPPTPPPPPPD